MVHQEKDFHGENVGNVVKYDFNRFNIHMYVFLFITFYSNTL